MAKEAREIIAFSESQIEPKDRLREFKLGALYMARVAIDYAEKIGALPASLPQFSKVTELTQARAETQADTLSPRDRIRAGLGFTPEQLAQHPDQITPDTKAYIGSLVHRDSEGKIVPILEQLVGVERIYNAEGREIPTCYLDIGDKTAQYYEQTLDGVKDIEVGSAGRSMVRHPDFAKDLLPNATTIRLIFLDGFDIGYPSVATISQRYERGQELGANLCPPEVGPAQRIADTEQPVNTYYWIAMKQIADSYGFLGVFGLERIGDSRWLGGSWAVPDSRWDPEGQLAFAFPQVPSKP